MNKTNVRHKFEYIIFTTVIFLIVFGLFVLFSASNEYLFFRQIVFCICGLIITILISFIPYTAYERFVKIFFILCLLLVIITAFAGRISRGASRWMEFKGFTFQPSELMKLALILYLPSILSKSITENTDKIVYNKMMMIAYGPALIVCLNNLSTGIIMFLISTLMIFLVSKKIIIYLSIMLLSVMYYVFAYPISRIIYNMGLLKRYQVVRIFAWKEPESFKDTAYQTLQSIYAIGSGKLFGRGYLNSFQKNLIPESHNDMIFSIICEELGFIGAMIFIILYIFLIFRIIVIAKRISDIKISLIVYGVAIHIALQVILNIAVATNLLPNTGVTLPFVSYGGSSLVVLFIEIGIIMSIYRFSIYE